MKNLYSVNNLFTYEKEDIIYKNFLIEILSHKFQSMLLKQNRAWQFFQIEAHALISRNLVNENYTNDDIFAVISDKDLCLKPETTASSFEYAKYLLSNQSSMPPLCVWQASKSFRQEQDQSFKHIRFKEFTHLEFQCIFTSDTKNDYLNSCINDIAKIFQDVIKLPTRIVLSDRLPEYSLKTIDIEVLNNDKWMEICSASLRKDFKYEHRINNKIVSFLVFEIATSIDRLIYNIHEANDYHKLTVENTLI